MKRTDNLILVILIVASMLYGAAQVYLNLHALEVSSRMMVLWAFFYALLVAIWANKEPKQAEFGGTFEFPALVYFLWPVVLPYYLIKTRGLEGFVLFMGFVALYYLPDALGWLVYLSYD